jgi:hypothetical protein
MTNIQEMNNRQIYRRLEFVNGMIERVLNDGENEDVYNRQKTEYMIERHELKKEIEGRGFMVVD